MFLRVHCTGITDDKHTNLVTPVYVVCVTHPRYIGYVGVCKNVLSSSIRTLIIRVRKLQWTWLWGRVNTEYSNNYTSLLIQYVIQDSLTYIVLLVHVYAITYCHDSITEYFMETDSSNKYRM